MREHVANGHEANQAKWLVASCTSYDVRTSIIELYFTDGTVTARGQKGKQAAKMHYLSTAAD